MTFDATFRPLATRLLRTLSRLQVTYKRVTPGAYDPATGSSTPTTVSSTVYAYAASPNALQFNAGLVQQGDILIYLSGEELGFKPAPGDKVAYEGADWTVKALEFFSSGTMDALYTVTVSKT